MALKGHLPRARWSPEAPPKPRRPVQGVDEMGHVGDRVCPRTPVCYAAAAGRRLTSHFPCARPPGAPTLTGCSWRRLRSQPGGSIWLSPALSEWELEGKEWGGQERVQSRSCISRLSQRPSRGHAFITSQASYTCTLCHPCDDPPGRGSGKEADKERRLSESGPQSGRNAQSQAPTQTSCKPSTRFSAHLLPTRQAAPKAKAHSGPAHWCW